MAGMMGLRISASALFANRTKLDVISQNIANADSVNAATGEPYRRRAVTVESDVDFSQVMSSENSKLGLSGVKASEVFEDQAPFETVYDPEDPNADEEGFVLKSNVNITREMLDLLMATRAYEANLTVFNSTKDMILKTLRLGE